MTAWTVDTQISSFTIECIRRKQSLAKHVLRMLIRGPDTFFLHKKANIGGQNRVTLSLWTFKTRIKKCKQIKWRKKNDFLIEWQLLRPKLVNLLEKVAGIKPWNLPCVWPWGTPTQQISLFQFSWAQLAILARKVLKLLRNATFS